MNKTILRFLIEVKGVVSLMQKNSKRQTFGQSSQRCKVAERVEKSQRCKIDERACDASPGPMFDLEFLREIFCFCHHNQPSYHPTNPFHYSLSLIFSKCLKTKRAKSKKKKKIITNPALTTMRMNDYCKIPYVKQIVYLLYNVLKF